MAEAPPFGLHQASGGTTFIDRPRLHEIHPSLGSKSLEGLAASPNRTLGLMAERAGINFPNGLVPVKIVLNRANMLKFLARAPKDAIAIKHALRRNASGIYDPFYHAMFVRDALHEHHEAHEMTHAKIAITNPDFVETEVQYEKVRKAKKQGTDTQSFDIEKVIAYTYFQEGLSEWVALTVRRDPISYQDADVTPLEADLATLKAFFNLKGRPTKAQVRTYNEAFDRLVVTKMPYTVGTNFIKVAMQQLEAAGIERDKAIDMLIQNPPTTFDAILNPQQVIQKLLPPAPTKMVA